MAETQSPVGVCDSGFGGLSVLRELRAALPAEDIIYYADSAYCPYGERSPEEILERSSAVMKELLGRGAKLIVVACNTACSVALEELRATSDVPIVGLEPAVKPAVAVSRSGRIGVLATPRTASGDRLERLIERHAHGVEVIAVAAPGLVDMVEAGYTAGSEVSSALHALLDPLLERGIDTLVLGCTHYPFLRATIQEVVGPGVALIDSGEAIARRTRNVLITAGKLRLGTTAGSLAVYTSGRPAEVSSIASRLLGEQIIAMH